jgi:hypothetical protein
MVCKGALSHLHVDIACGEGCSRNLTSVSALQENALPAILPRRVFPSSLGGRAQVLLSQYIEYDDILFAEIAIISGDSDFMLLCCLFLFMQSLFIVLRRVTSVTLSLPKLTLRQPCASPSPYDELVNKAFSHEF